MVYVDSYTKLTDWLIDPSIPCLDKKTFSPFFSNILLAIPWTVFFFKLVLYTISPHLVTYYTYLSCQKWTVFFFSPKCRKWQQGKCKSVGWQGWSHYYNHYCMYIYSWLLSLFIWRILNLLFSMTGEMPDGFVDPTRLDQQLWRVNSIVEKRWTLYQVYLLAPLIHLLKPCISNPTRTDGVESDLLDWIPPSSDLRAQPICHRWKDFSVVDIGNPLRSIDLRSSLFAWSPQALNVHRDLQGLWSCWNLHLLKLPSVVLQLVQSLK